MDTNISIQILSSTTVFNIDNKKKCLLLEANQHIKLFLKDQWRLDCWKFSHYKNNILYKKIYQNSYSKKNIFSFYCICHQINAALVNLRDFFQNTKKYQP